MISNMEYILSGSTIIIKTKNLFLHSDGYYTNYIKISKEYNPEFQEFLIYNINEENTLIK